MIRILSICAILAGCTTWNPPAEFDGPFAGEMVVQRMPQANVQASCDAMFAWAGYDIETTPQQLGCAAEVSGVCYIITIDRMTDGVTPQAVLRHERGHCNGWPEDHGGTRPTNERSQQNGDSDPND